MCRVSSLLMTLDSRPSLSLLLPMDQTGSRLFLFVAIHQPVVVATVSEFNALSGSRLRIDEYLLHHFRRVGVQNPLWSGGGVLGLVAGAGAGAVLAGGENLRVALHVGLFQARIGAGFGQEGAQ